jgi:hypothetical protein
MALSFRSRSRGGGRLGIVYVTSRSRWHASSCRSALTAVRLAATIQIFVQELTKARREKVAAAHAALEGPATPA